MEPASPSAGAAADKPRGLLIGVGNTLCGDDGIGPAVALRVHELLGDREAWDVVELCCSPLDIVERLAGYPRAVVVDALVDWDAPEGTLFRVTFEEQSAGLSPPSHALGFASALALARAAGLALPQPILFYGIVVKGPLVFGARLSPAIEARIEAIARQIVQDLTSQGDDSPAGAGPAFPPDPPAASAH